MTLLIFTILNFINVILQTLKTRVTARYNNKLFVASVNMITFGFYTAIIKQISENSLIVGVVVTALCNFVGVPVCMWIMEKLEKDKLWIMRATVLKEDVKNELFEELREYDISFTATSAIKYKYGDESTVYTFNIYLPSQDETTKAVGLMQMYKIKYNIVETK